MSIDPRAVVGKEVEIGQDVEIGPFAIIQGHVRIGRGTRIYPNAYISGWVEIGQNCEVHPHVVLGHLPQDFHFKPGTRTYLKIGDGTIIREMASIHSGTQPETATIIGSKCFILCSAHIGHNCVIGDEAKVYSFTAVSGHVEVGSRAIVSGVSAVHQFVRIGELAMIGGVTPVTSDVPPFTTCARDYGCTGINAIGMKRQGHRPEAIEACRQAFKLLYRSGKSFRKALEELDASADCEEVRRIVEFCKGPSKRGIMRGRPRLSRGPQPGRP
jgi:UDP-N-acetylglucosamine acyltransferase